MPTQPSLFNVLCLSKSVVHWVKLCIRTAGPRTYTVFLLTTSCMLCTETMESFYIVKSCFTSRCIQNKSQSFVKSIFRLYLLRGVQPKHTYPFQGSGYTLTHTHPPTPRVNFSKRKALNKTDVEAK
jgi:hypothetical protein